MNSGFLPFTFTFFLFFISFPGNLAAAGVTLHSIRLYKTHEWVVKPKVYFQCRGETNTLLPDVKKAKVEYVFKGQESWQPLTDFLNKKCKRCKLYEKDKFPWSHTDTLDEWEFCPSDFKSPDAKYTLVKSKKFNATFSCPKCLNVGKVPHVAAPKPERKGLSIGIVILISCSASIMVIVGFIGAYKFWKKRKRQQEQLRFLKLFDEQDDLEDELGLADDI